MAVGQQPIVIKKVKKSGAAAHHGGAWKVAYADFVTAMMAFFLLMWLINTTSPEQKRGIADYFAPASVSESNSGSGGILGGTALGEDGGNAKGSQATIEKRAPDAPPEMKSDNPSGSPNALNGQDQAAQQKEEAAFQSAAASLR